jgi:hypothetical protein
MYLQELKTLYKYETNEEKKIHIQNLIKNKILESRQQWYKKENKIPQKNLFTRMLAEVEGLNLSMNNNDLEQIEKPFDEKFDQNNKVNNKKKLGLRKDII